MKADIPVMRNLERHRIRRGLLLAAACVFLGGAGAARAEFSVYGLIDFGHRRTVDGSISNMTFDGNSPSRLGIKGQVGEDDEDWRTTFNFETSIHGTDEPIRTDRASWVGLGAGFGEFRFGRQYSPAWLTMIGYDFNGASSTVCAACFVGAGWIAGPEQDFGNGTHMDNSLQYLGSWGPVQVTAGYKQVQDDDPPEAKWDVVSFGTTLTLGSFATSLAVQSSSTSAPNYTGAAVLYDLGTAKVKMGLHTIGKESKVIDLGVVALVEGFNFGETFSINIGDGIYEGAAFEVFVNRKLGKDRLLYAEIGNRLTPLRAFDDQEGERVESGFAYAIGIIVTF